MKLLVPFSIAAAIVAALIFTALRDDAVPITQPVSRTTTPVETIAAPQPDIEAQPAVVMSEPEEPSDDVDIEQLDNAALMLLLRDYGFDRLESKWKDWALSRGYPALDGSGGSSGYLYDQPYEQYDDDVLRGLAGNGDMWAQQILAKRLATKSPAEAVELYRQAAIRGSVYAMSEMASLYGRISDSKREVEFKSDELALDQVYAMRDAPISPQVAGFAWTAVAELAGTEPMFGNIAASQFNRTLSDDEKAEGCAMARGMYDEISQARAGLGLGDFNRQPPPIVYWDPRATSSCEHSDKPHLDLSDCRQVEMNEEGQSNTIWICAE